MVTRKNLDLYGVFAPRRYSIDTNFWSDEWIYSRLSLVNFLVKNKWISSDLSSNYLISQQNPRLLNLIIWRGMVC